MIQKDQALKEAIANEMLLLLKGQLHTSQARADCVVKKLFLSRYRPRVDEAAALALSQSAGALALTRGQVDLIEKIASRAIDPIRVGGSCSTVGRELMGQITKSRPGSKKEQEKSQ